MQQRDTAWHYARLGKVTASRFKDILTQPRTKKQKEAGELSETAKTYACEVASEIVTGQLLPSFRSNATDFGIENEEFAFNEAKAAIEAALGTPVLPPKGENAFWQHPDEPMIGCSPDGIIGDDGLLELKCRFNHAIHYRTVRAGGMPKEHIPQVQGNLWIARKRYYYFGSYCPQFKDCDFGIEPLFLLRIERDNDYIDNTLAPAVLNFVQYIRNDLKRTSEAFRRSQAWRTT